MNPSRIDPTASWPRLRPLGDAALCFEFGADIDPATHARVMGFAAALEARRRAGELPGVVEWVPAFASLTVYFEPGSEAVESDAESLGELARQAPPLTHAGTEWRIPVCFEGEHGPDLAALAKARGLDPAEVVALLCGAEFRVYLLGFQPGFAYMGGLPAACELPRLTVPRRAVPERSLAVAGRMCAIYPWQSPGGWHLLGRTPLRPFDLQQQDRPALFAPGDLVRWQAIDAGEYHELEALARCGELARERFVVAGGGRP